MESQEIVAHAAGEIERRSEPTLLEVIRELAVDSRVDVEKLAGLMNLQERAEARQAEREYTQAFAAMQLELPRVAKNGSIDLGKGKPMPFAKWEDVDAAIRPILARHGFTLSFPTRIDDQGRRIMACVIKHIGGHAERSEEESKPDPGPGRNAKQAEGSGRSYSKRYLTLDMLNIVTEGVDDDGGATGWITEQQADDLMTALADLGISESPDKMSRYLRAVGAKTVSEIQAGRLKDAWKLIEDTKRLRAEKRGRT